MSIRNLIIASLTVLFALALFYSCERKDLYNGSSGDPSLGLTLLPNNTPPIDTITTMPLWVAVGNGGQVWTSPDASAGSWTSGTAGPLDLHGIAIGGSRIAIVGGQYPNGLTSTVFTSNDGNAWTAGTGPGTALLSITWYGFGYMAVGSTGAGSPYALLSADGLSWIPTTTGIPATTQLAIAVAYGPCGSDLGFAVVGGSGVGCGTATIDTGVTWSPSLCFGTRLNSVANGGGVFVAVGQNGNCKRITSINPLAWVDPTTPLTGGVNYNSVVYSGGRFVAVANSGIVSYSDDLGDNWTNLAAITVSHLLGVATDGAGKLVAVGQGGSIFISTDNGVTWSGNVGPGGTDINTVVFRP